MHRLAALAERTIKASPKALYDALHGRLREHHRFLLKGHLRQWDALDAAIPEIARPAPTRRRAAPAMLNPIPISSPRRGRSEPALGRG
jgi:hypothetical protein